jgi:CDP-glucose 4,6-dehydratase
MKHFQYFSGKTVLVTGHTGFKGSWLVQWLLQLGANVIGYSLESSENTKLFEILNIKEKIHHYYGDVNDLTRLKDIFNRHQPEIVFHLAAQAIVKSSYEDPLNTFKTNVIGTVNVLESIRIVNSVTTAVIVTSDKCYKNEEKKKEFKETDAMGGDDPYSASKACAELVIHSYRHSFFENSNTKIISVRAGNILGGGDWSKDRIMVDIVNSIEFNKPIFLRNPAAVRPWQHVLDACYGYLQAVLYSEDSTSEFIPSWNFGPAKNQIMTVEEIVNLSIKEYGKGSYEILGKPSFHEANYLRINVDLATEKLGWGTCFRNEEVIIKTIEWYKAFYKGEDVVELTYNQVVDYMNRLK